MPESYFIYFTMIIDSIKDKWKQCLSGIAIN